MAKKLMIVIEEIGEGKDFKVYLDGDKQRIGKMEVNKLSPAEFWASALLGVVNQAMEKVTTLGIIKTTKDEEKKETTFCQAGEGLFVVEFSNRPPIFCEKKSVECYQGWVNYVAHQELTAEQYLKAVRSL